MTHPRVARSVSALASLALATTLSAQDAALEPPAMPAFDPAAVDTGADPCEDFYQYACGGWHAQNPRPADRSFWSRPFSQFSDQLDDYVTRLIEYTATLDQRTPDQQKVADYLTACTDLATIEARGLEPFLRELAPIDSMSSIEELGGVLGTLQRSLPWLPMDGEPLLYLDPVADGNEPMALRTGPAGLGLGSPDYYADRSPEGVELLERYQKHIASMLALIGESPEAAAEMAEAILGLETTLAAAYLPKEVVRNQPSATQNPMGLAELEALTPSLDWPELLRAHGLPKEVVFNPREPDYLRSLEASLTGHPLETWKAYLRWQLLAERAKLLPEAIRKERFSFFGRELYGLEAEPDRLSSCVGSLKSDLTNVLDRVFLEAAYDPSSTDRTTRIFEEVRDVMRDRIRRNDWLEAETKEEAIAKVDAARITVAQPEVWLDDRRLVIRPDDHYGNVQRAGEAARRVSFDRLGRPTDPNWWSDSTTWVLGYYMSRSNSIVISAAMVLLLDDGANDPAALWGGLGMLLVHELIHGFDPNGRNYDASGANRDWWTEADTRRFEERATCVADQFSQFEYAPGIPVDGDFVVSEQFTELAATEIGWDAYLRSSLAASDGERGGFTPAQRYLLTMAQTWCSTATDGEWRARASGKSSKAWAAPMVHGTVLNVPGFAEAFSCEPGDAMVKAADEICETW